MKASVKFREEQGPLLRAKVPVSVSGIPLSSGIALGQGYDLALHLGTSFDAGPSCRIAYKPNDAFAPFSFILKTGFGPWGSPCGASLAMTAEFDLAGNRGPFFSVKVKPKAGDFGLRMRAGSLHPSKLEYDRDGLGLVRGGGGGGDKEGQSSDSNSNSDGEVLCSPPKNNGFGFSSPGERRKGVGSDASRVIGSNFAFKIEGLEREKKCRERKQIADRVKLEQENSLAAEQELAMRGGGERGSIVPKHFSRAFKGWTAHAQTSLPLSRRAKLNILWGINVPSELFESWDQGSNSSPFSFSTLKFPFLSIDKLSVEGVGLKPRKEMYLPEFPLLGTRRRPPENNHGMDHELDKAIASCYSMKRDLRYLYAETRILRRAMEAVGDEIRATETLDEKKAKQWKIDHPQKKDGTNRKEVELMKSKLNGLGWKLEPQSDLSSSQKSDRVVVSKDSIPADVSKEAEKSIPFGSVSSSGDAKKASMASSK